MTDPRSFFVDLFNEDDLRYLGGFDCGDQIMNDFYKTEEFFQEMQLGLNATYALFFKGELAVLCSICADRINLAQDEKEENAFPRGAVPAIKIARIGREIRFKENRLGKLMIDYIILKILKDYHKSIGVRMITLDAYPNRVSFYEDLGFKVNKNQGRNNPNVSMRLDIFDYNPE
ncbi:GNAT family N-acetyltransferase [Neobacillus sp. YIM B06451]|uniref:GNAT family N-acetyltransferase n=1 Tax=Neobacillus sp. YIM B06451 TaxID=3070994 RepID=UPI00292CD507|nr:GNAT family N-acetyltransferase [Neobacillus sp. YIM B06451]